VFIDEQAEIDAEDAMADSAEPGDEGKAPDAVAEPTPEPEELPPAPTVVTASATLYRPSRDFHEHQRLKAERLQRARKEG
jgi:hypothetical protein